MDMGNRKNLARDARIRSLVYHDGLTYPQAAERAGVSQGVVAGVAHRTPHRLRAILTAPS